MTRLTRTALVLATTLGLAGTATTARADHDDRWRDHERVTVVVPAPAPAYVPAPAPAYAAAPYLRVRWAGGGYHALREEYRRLDLARDRFYATWDGNPWRRDRFEAWYAGRRAELDARWAVRAHWEGERRDRW
jgi:hypothetical protein